MFYDNFLKLCTMKSVSPTKVMTDLGFSKATASRWKKNVAQPTLKTLNKLSEYFGVSVQELLISEDDELQTLVSMSPAEAYTELDKMAARRGLDIDRVITDTGINKALLQGNIKRTGYAQACINVFYAIKKDLPASDGKQALMEDIIKDISNLSDDEVIRLKAILRAAFPDRFLQ